MPREYKRQPICPRCKMANKQPGQSYCLPCGRQYKRENWIKLKTEPPKIARIRKPTCPRCHIRLKHKNWAYCRPCMLAWRSARAHAPSLAEREMTALQLTPEVAGYAAGIIDGEGCVTLMKHKGKTPTTLIAVGNTDRRLLEWLCGHFGGFIRLVHSQTDKCRAAWAWHLSTIQARCLLRAIQQYLVIKKRHAELVLAFHEALQTRPFRERLLEPFPEPFASMVAELQALNRKGPRHGVILPSP